MKKVIFSAVLACGAFFATNASDEPIVEHHEAAIEDSSAFGGFYFGLGFHAANVGEKNQYTWSPADGGTTDDEINASATRLGGSIVAGFGKKFSSRTYAGIEAGLDFAPNTTFAEYSKYSDRSLVQQRVYDVTTT
ncbi:MAG: hypothetical protein LBF44_01615, partial [Holosporaceae bacterium]|nr:hypothetical protein [Holosporaceae bacterium]